MVLVAELISAIKLDLDEAKRHVRGGKSLIQEQQLLIDRLRSHGQRTELPTALLQPFRETQALPEAELDQLTYELTTAMQLRREQQVGSPNLAPTHWLLEGASEATARAERVLAEATELLNQPAEHESRRPDR